MTDSIFSRRFRLIGFLLAIVGKFWLIWASEIVDATDDPHEYMLQILYPSNGGLTYPPGTGLVGDFFLALGIPYRLGIEAAFLFAVAFVLRALFAWPWQSYLSLGLFYLLAFDPAVVELFSHLFSDPVWLVETMLGLACFVLAYRHEERLDWNAIFPAIFFLGLSLITRSVSVPLLLCTIVFALMALALVLAKFRSENLKRHLDLLAFTVPTLVFAICLIYGGICHFNYLRHGYTGISYIDSNEYKKFYLTLQAVGEPTGEPYFPIDLDRRKVIAQAGPDSKWFIRQLEENRVYKDVGVKKYGRDDIPAGWFHWAAFTASMDPAKGDYTTSFALFNNIEEEIESSKKAGSIRVRHILPLPDARLFVVAETFPSGLHNAVGESWQEPSPATFKQPGTYQDADFTKMLTRRTVSASPVREAIWSSLACVYGWLYTPVTFYLYLLALLGLMGVIALRWNRFEEFSMLFIARHIFTVMFLVLLFWYALFDASGMPVLARYMIFNHLLLIPLICFYAAESLRWYRLDNRD